MPSSALFGAQLPETLLDRRCTAQRQHDDQIPGLRPGELSLDYQSEASCDGAPSADSDAEDSAEGGDDTPPQSLRRPPRRGPSPRENGPSLNPTWD